MSSITSSPTVGSGLFVIDGQLHAAPGHGSAQELLAMMGAVGVDAALLTQFTALGSDNSFILSLVNRYPHRFGAVGIVDATQPALEEQLTAWKREPGAVGVRIVIRHKEDVARLESGWYEDELSLAEKTEVPVFIFCPSDLGALRAIAGRYPTLRLVIDHLGLPTLRDEAGPHVFDHLDGVLSLAEFENVAIKCSAAPVHSALDYPFDDLWPHFDRIFEAFGLERVIWGSDINRIGGMPFSYAEALGFIQDTGHLSVGEKRLLLGESLRRWVGWNPVGAPPLGD